MVWDQNSPEAIFTTWNFVLSTEPNVTKPGRSAQPQSVGQTVP